MLEPLRKAPDDLGTCRARELFQLVERFLDAPRRRARVHREQDGTLAPSLGVAVGAAAVSTHGYGIVAVGGRHSPYLRGGGGAFAGGEHRERLERDQRIAARRTRSAACQASAADAEVAQGVVERR